MSFIVTARKYRPQRFDEVVELKLQSTAEWKTKCKFLLK